jgi:glycosyltransferase involved in cell wall biosynthesis
MARRWAAKNEVFMITTDRDSSRPFRGWRHRSVDGIEVSSCFVPYSNHMSFRDRVQAFTSFALRAGQEAVRIGGDVVFATSTPLTIAVPGVWASKRLSVPMVFEVRDLWPEVPIAVGAIRNPGLIWAARALERFSYRNARRIVALSPDMAKGIVATGYPSDRLEVVPNSADNAEFDAVQPGTGAVFSALPHLRETRFVAYCGTLGEVNGVSYLVEVAAECLRAGESLEFLVVGDGKDRESVEATARARGVLGRNFWMHRPVSKRDVRSVFVTASACCSTVVDIPALWANSANKFFDTMAAGRPVIINHGGWQADLITENACGIVLPAGDPVRAAAMLREFFSDSERVRSAGLRAKKIAQEAFDRDRLSAQLLGVLEDAVRSVKGSRRC